MEIEVIEFYPMERDEEREILTGTLRVKLPDIGIHILGIYVSKRKESWIFSLPGRSGVHHKTGEKCRYPYVVFDEREKQNALIASLREKGRAFIENRLADTENPLVFPEMIKKESTESRHSKASNIAPAVKEPVALGKHALNQAITSKQWMDPPARKTPAKRFN